MYLYRHYRLFLAIFTKLIKKHLNIFFAHVLTRYILIICTIEIQIQVEEFMKNGKSPLTVEQTLWWLILDFGGLTIYVIAHLYDGKALRL